MTRAVAVLRAAVFATATLAVGAAFAASTDVTEAPAAPATQVAQAEKPAADATAPVKHKAKKAKVEEKAEAKPEAKPEAAPVAAPAVAAVTPPPSKASRELLRRVLLDACVYQENAKEDAAADEKSEKTEKAEKPEVKANKLSAKQQKILDACQCASTKAIKPVKDEEIGKIDEHRQVPDAWYQATTEAYATCKR